MNSLSSLFQSFDDDIAMWRKLSVDHVGLISPKLEAVGWDAARNLVTQSGSAYRTRRSRSAWSTTRCAPSFVFCMRDGFGLARAAGISAVLDLYSCGYERGQRLFGMLLDAGYQGAFDLEILGPRIEQGGLCFGDRASVERASEILDRLGPERGPIPFSSAIRRTT